MKCFICKEKTENPIIRMVSINNGIGEVQRAFCSEYCETKWVNSKKI